MTLWGDYKTFVRRSILKDPTPINWTEDNLVDFCRMALNTFCAHTAVATATGYEGDGATSVFELPSNMYLPIDSAGMAYTQSGTTKTFLNPVLSTIAVEGQSQDTYFLFPEDTLNLYSPLPTGTTLWVRYFGMYNYPVQDTDVLQFPRWAETAIAYLMGFHAMSAPGVQSAEIRQWGVKPDTGNPEDNSLRAQGKYFMQVYEQELARYPRQQRETYFREKGAWTPR